MKPEDDFDRRRRDDEDYCLIEVAMPTLLASSETTGRVGRTYYPNLGARQALRPIVHA